MDNRKLFIIGASGHGKVIADIAALTGYHEILFLDDNESKTDCMGYPVVGKSTDFKKYSEGDFIVAVGNPIIRERMQKELESNNITITTLVHPGAVIAANVRLGKGTVVMAGAVINPDTIIGNGCIVNTGATVDHDNFIGDYVHVSVGSHLAGAVTVESRTWIGAGATVSNNIKICSDCIIGAGAVVVNDIARAGTYTGVPARKVKEAVL